MDNKHYGHFICIKNVFCSYDLDIFGKLFRKSNMPSELFEFNFTDSF